MIEDGEAVGRHPVIGEGEGRGEIGRAGFRRAVDAGLERIAPPAAQPLRQGSNWYRRRQRRSRARIDITYRGVR